MKTKILFLFLFASIFGWGQFNIDAGSTNYTQNFNSLTSGTWINNTTLTGWYVRTSATALISSYGANTGTTTTAGFYAYGVAGANPLTDRALGFSTTNSFTGSAGAGKNFIGWRLKNNTGAKITSISVTWTGEQWRKESNTNSQTIELFYQTGITVNDLTTGTWSATSSTFTSPITGSATGTNLDGNLPVNRVASINATITVDIEDGEEIMLRWDDLNDSGNDHHLTIDDVTINATVVAVGPTLTVSPISLTVDSYVEGNGPVATATTPVNVMGDNLEGNVTINAPANFEISTSATTGFGSSVTLTESGGEVDENVYVRLISGLSGSEAAYTGNLTVNSTNADEETVALSGIVQDALNVSKLDWPLNGTITEGGTLNVYIKAYEPGLTDVAGNESQITAWVGYSADNVDLDPRNENGWIWVPAAFDVRTDANTNYQYLANVNANNLPAGTYRYAARFRIGTNGAYTYGGIQSGNNGGNWDGVTYGNGTLNINSLIGWANFQSPCTGATTLGSTYDVFGRIYADGITNPAGSNNRIEAQVGYNSADTNPNTWSNWYNADWNVQYGNDDEYMLNIGQHFTAPGTYYMAFRYRVDGGSWYYGGRKSGTCDGTGGGQWNGTTNINASVVINAPSNTSDIIASTTFTYPTNIAYGSYQATDIIGGASDIEVARFIIRDGGTATPDSDAFGTTLNNLTMSLSNSANVRRVAIYDGATEIQEIAGNGTLNFTGLNLTAPDNGTKEFSIRVSFNSAVTDNQQIQFAITSAATITTGSSTFAATNAGAASSSIAGDDNRIEVTADRIAFTTQPSNTGINASMSNVVVSATDSNNNMDLDHTGSVNLTSTGTMTGDPITQSFGAGTGNATFSGIVHTVAQTGRQLTATTTGLSFSNTATSTTFDITEIVYANGDYRSKANGNWHSTANSGSTNTWQQFNGTTWVDISNSPPSNSAGLGTKKVYIQNEITLVGTNTAPNVIVLENGKLYTSSVGATFGKLLIKSGGEFYRQANGSGISSEFEVEDNGTVYFYHTNSTSRSSSIWAGTEKFHPNSNFIIKTIDNTSNFQVIQSNNDISEYLGACFGNLIIDYSAGNSLWLIPAGFNKKLTNGNLIFRSANNNVRLSNVSYNTIVGNNLIIENTFSSRKVNLYTGTSGTANLTIEGNIIHSGDDDLNLNTQNGGTINLFLKGDLLATSGLLTSTATSGSNFNFSGIGNGLTPETTQTISYDIAVFNNIDFTVNYGAYLKLNTHIRLIGASSMTVNGTFDADMLVLAGDDDNLQTLTVNNGGIFKTLNPLGFSNDGGSVNVQIDLQDGSTVEYYAEGSQLISNQTNVGQGTLGNYYNLRISGSGEKTIDGEIHVNNITYVDSGTLLVAETTDSEAVNTLYAHKGITVATTGATLLLQNNANLMQDAGAVNSGNITQLRKATVPSNQYNFWTSPVKNQLLYSLYPGIPSGKVMVYNTATDYFNGLPVSSNPTSSFGKGYSIKGSNQPAHAPNVTATFVGVPQNESLTSTENLISLSNVGQRFNLIGNPFPSNLDLKLVNDHISNSGKIENSTFYFWDNTDNTATTQQGSSYVNLNYANYNASSDIGTAAPRFATGGKKPNGIVKPGQGFIVQATTGTTGIIVENSMRTTQIRQLTDTEDAVYFKNGEGSVDDIYSSRPRNDKFWLEMVNPLGMHVQIAVGYFKQAENTFDTYDSKILSESVSDNFYSLSKDAQKLSIQGRHGSFEDSDVILLGTKFFVLGKYKIQLEETLGIFKVHQTIYLKDKYLNEIHNLSQSPYDFEGNPGVFEDRFEIVFKDGNQIIDPLLSSATDHNDVKITKKDRQIEITSSIDKILEVEIFNLSGWSVYKNKKVNSNVLNVPASLFGKQIIVVKVQTETGKIVTKKIINK